MIPHIHNEKILHEEHVDSAHNEKHRSRLTSWWRNRDLLLNIFLIVDPTHPNWPNIRERIFGFLVLLQISFVGVVCWLAGMTSGVWLLALFIGLSAFVGAFLLQSWWALLVTPFAVVIGVVLPGQSELDMFLIAVALPAFLGTVLGSVFVKQKGVQGRRKGVS